ncbi:hypothetical protein SKAU_G00212650 [Synaphobranchus kaupii]|uniref:Uncharacterized protein n=1 Tax=Synaphobranchus kaupii TaxID=118154 RepID=A0A9Q1F9M6_SYNKA|nr:hypothetical protein SKAU_G00212650 [Synaphobranchus kaupii]
MSTAVRLKGQVHGRNGPRLDQRGNRGVSCSQMHTGFRVLDLERRYDEAVLTARHARFRAKTRGDERGNRDGNNQGEFCGRRLGYLSTLISTLIFMPLPHPNNPISQIVP